MTRVDPSLFVNQLVVTRKGTRVYDQKFHRGVNIIRGSNSSGKSTIADFLFFVLGGDIHSWKPEAGVCDQVFAEIELSGAHVTLARPVTPSPRQEMRVFWGSLAQAESNVTAWQTYPFRRSENRESFSQVLLSAVGVPEVRSDMGSLITMHQLLRLIYVDQLTPVDALMRSEQFDSVLAREAARDLMFGVYDDSVYEDEARLREAKSELELAKRQYRGTLSVFEAAEQDIDPTSLVERLKSTEAALEQTDASIGALRSREERPHEVPVSLIDESRAEFLEARQSLVALQNDMDRLQIEIEDSTGFLDSIERRLQAVRDSQLTQAALKDFPPTLCPECLRALPPRPSADVCPVCDQHGGVSHPETQIARYRQELRFQASESKRLLEQRRERAESLRRALPEARAVYRRAAQKRASLVSTAQSERDVRVDELLIRKGTLEAQLNSVHAQLKAAAILDTLRKRQTELKNVIDDLTEKIRKKRATQSERLTQIDKTIDEIAKRLLRRDLRLEEAFENPSAVTTHFGENTFAVDGRNQFSASSMTLLKNAVHFAILYASLRHPFVRYPRLAIFDNMEDKGMEQGRSHNFQRQIVELFAEAMVEHQIIFTTSMIAPDLDRDDLTVGPRYSNERKTLKMT